MKTRIFTAVALITAIGAFFIISTAGSRENNGPGETRGQVYSSPELTGIAGAWIEKFNQSGPERQFTVVPAEGTAAGQLMILTGQQLSEAEAGWQIAVGREVAVPVIHTGNPAIKEFYDKGITPEMLAKALAGTATTFFISDDPVILSRLEAFLGAGIVASVQNQLVKEEQVVAMVQSHPGAIGICKLASLVSAENGTLPANIAFLPIDRNGNGKLDNFENIYSDVEAFARGVWIGKYPKSLCQDIYLAAASQPVRAEELALVNWILTDGQPMLAHFGFTHLVYAERQSKLGRLNAVPVVVPPARRVFPVMQVTLVSLAVLLFIAFIISAVSRQSARKAGPVSETGKYAIPGVFNMDAIRAPKGIFFDSSHTWAFMEKDGSVRVGIDDFLQHVTGPISRVEMKSPGTRIKKGEVLFSIIQQGKQLKISSPVSGIVKEQNPSLATNAALINAAPYAEGWVYTIEPFDWMRESRLMSMADRYLRWLRDEFVRLKDFLATAVNADKQQYAMITLQDGGELRDHTLSELGPEVWEDFQTEFLDKSK